MRVIVNICAFLSLFTVVIHAAPGGPGAPVESDFGVCHLGEVCYGFEQPSLFRGESYG
jgi:hypothetical protein